MNSHAPGQQAVEHRHRGALREQRPFMQRRLPQLLQTIPELGSPNLSIAFHSTVLYNSILRFDDQMLINPHIYSMPAFRAPILHLRRIDGGPLFNTYVECFERIWAQSRPFDMERDA